jgi:hypothetical protein
MIRVKEHLGLIHFLAVMILRWAAAEKGMWIH